MGTTHDGRGGHAGGWADHDHDNTHDGWELHFDFEASGKHRKGGHAAMASHMAGAMGMIMRGG